MQDRINELEARLEYLDADSASPITQRAACAVFRDVLIPMVQSEIKATGFFGLITRRVLEGVERLLQRYVDKHCTST